MATTRPENKELARRFVTEVFVKGNLERLNQYMPPDYTEHTPTLGDIEGRKAVRDYYAGIQSAFPDFDVAIEDLIADDDNVVQRSLQSGTHEGEFKGIEATGNTVEVEGIVIYQIRDGNIAESRIQLDTMGLMDQLGVE